MTTQERVYMDAQDACGLKVGDYVKVLRKAENYEAGWNYTWYGGKRLVGETCKVWNIGITGIEIQTKGMGYYRVPYFVLEKVEKPKHEFKPFERVLVRDFQTEWMPHIFRSYNPNGTPYQTIDGNIFDYCIPYEGNEHLVGTTDNPE